MTKIPLTRIVADEAKQECIRIAVQAVDVAFGDTRIAQLDDVDALCELVGDPRVSNSIYTLPRTINRESITSFVRDHLAERARGEGLLLVTVDRSGEANAYHDIQIWPKWAACELGGAIHPDRQGEGRGGNGAAAIFDWLFKVIDINLICETAALDNIRTARLLNRIGFRHMGQIESDLPGGGVRPSQYWEMTKENWRTQHAKQPGGVIR